MPRRVERARRRLLWEKVAGAFGIAFAMFAIAALFTDLLPEGWAQRSLSRFWMSAVAGVVVFVIVRRQRRHEPVGRPE
jgi:uncharacterized membrane protein YcjF (UPF0283 family)